MDTGMFLDEEVKSGAPVDPTWLIHHRTGAAMEATVQTICYEKECTAWPFSEVGGKGFPTHAFPDILEEALSGQVSPLLPTVWDAGLQNGSSPTSEDGQNGTSISADSDCNPMDTKTFASGSRKSKFNSAEEKASGVRARNRKAQQAFRKRQKAVAQEREERWVDLQQEVEMLKQANCDMRVRVSSLEKQLTRLQT